MKKILLFLLVSAGASAQTCITGPFATTPNLALNLPFFNQCNWGVQGYNPNFTALDTIIPLKANLASPTFTGTVTLPASTTLITPILGTPTSVTLTNGTGLPESGVISLVADLALKAPLISPSFTTPAIGVATGTSLALSGALSAGSVTVNSDGVHAGISTVLGNTTLPTIPANSFGFIGPNSASFTSYFFRPPSTGPTATGMIQASAVSSNVSTLSYSSLSDNGTNVVTSEPIVSPTGGTQIIAQGVADMPNGAILTTACAAVVTVSAPGTSALDSISWTPNVSIKAVTGYTPATAGRLSINAYPTANNVNFDLCNPTVGTITPGAVVRLNWTVTRVKSSAIALTGGIYSQYSGDLNFATMTPSGATPAAQSFLAPDGTSNAITLLEDTSNAEHYMINTITTTVTNGQTLTYTAYGKRVVGTRNFQMQLSSSGFANTISGGVSLTDCSIVNAAQVSGAWTLGPVPLVASYAAPGWCKMVLTVVATADTSVHADVSSISGTTKSYVGDGLSTNAYWGLDLR